MKSKEIIEIIKQKTGRQEKEISKLIEATGIAIGGILYEGNSISLPGLGKFRSSICDEKIEQNSEGQNILYPPSVKVHFDGAESLLGKLKNIENDGQV